MAKKKVGAKRVKAKTKKKAVSKKQICKLVCGCKSGKKWEECCGRCALPC